MHRYVLCFPATSLLLSSVVDSGVRNRPSHALEIFLALGYRRELIARTEQLAIIAVKPPPLIEVAWGRPHENHEVGLYRLFAGGKMPIVFQFLTPVGQSLWRKHLQLWAFLVAFRLLSLHEMEGP